MRFRKEQILFVSALALGAYLWKSRDVRVIDDRVSPKRLAYQELPDGAFVLAELRATPALPAKNSFREPSESEPLPPRELEFPPLPELPIVLPPLDPGQDAAAYHQLRIAGGPPVQHEFAAVEPPDAPEPAVAAAVQGPTNQLPAQELKQRFDRLFPKPTGNPIYGIVHHPAKYTLVGKPIREDITFEMVSTRTGESLGAPRVHEAAKVLRIELADNLRNRIELEKLDLPGGVAGLPARIEFVKELLNEAREQPWVYAEAEDQARQIVEAAAAGDEVGYRWILRVLRAQGDLSRELAFYGSLPQEMAETPFRYRSQGQLWARLSLWADAEADLRRAVDLSPNDPRSLAALAGYLLDRGRAEEALPFAEKAERNRLQVPEIEDRYAIGQNLIAIYLALGRLDDATAALARTASGNGSGDREYLRGAVSYARGDFAGAAGLFEHAAAEATSPAPVLALALCNLKTGAWDEARSGLETARDEAPLLRARALSALGLMLERTGHPDEALDRLVEAEQTDPTDPYTLYLLGRQQRLAGDLDAAEQTLRRALALRDDLLEVFGEMALTLYEKHRQDESGGGQDLVRATRFMDRLVELDASRGRSLEYVELQGYLHFEAGDTNAARDAFTSGAARGSDFCELGLALLDYRQKRTKEAREQLGRVADDPGRAAATQAFARSALDLIDDHASKERVRDSFDRDRLGGLWDIMVGTIRPSLIDGRLVIRGGGGGRVNDGVARRTVRAMNFIRVAVTMQVLDGLGSTSAAGLRLSKGGRGARAGQDFEVRVGMRPSSGRPRPFVRVIDGKSEGSPEQILEALGAVDFSEPQRLAVEAVPAEDAQARFDLKIYWNDRLVHTVAGVKSLTPSSAWPLNTDLIASGSRVDVAFDDYRLDRRKEN